MDQLSVTFEPSEKSVTFEPSEKSVTFQPQPSEKWPRAGSEWESLSAISVALSTPKSFVSHICVSLPESASDGQDAEEDSFAPTGTDSLSQTESLSQSDSWEQ